MAQGSEERQEKAANLSTDTTQLHVFQPNWLMCYQRFPNAEWGFVAFKVGSHREGQWEAYKQKLNEIIRLPFRVDEQVPGVKEAAEHFAIKWIEDDDLTHAGVKQMQERFAEIQPNLAFGMSTQLFFAATPQSVSHLLASSTPDPSSQRWRPDPPYVLAVSSSSDHTLEEDHEEREWFQESFKVAAETIVDELWFVLEQLSWPVRRITRGIKGTHLVNGEQLESQENSDLNKNDLAEVWWSSAPSPEQLARRRRIRYA